MDALTSAFVRFRDRGDAEALGRVFDGLAPRLLALALHLCGHPADAEDLVQQTFVQAMRNAAQFDAARPLEPWLCGLLANLARNHRRREGHRHGTPLADAELPSGEAGPASAAERGELIALLHTRIDALPAEQRQCLLLQLQHGLSPAEIADVLAVPAGTVRMRIHRGLASLRRLLPAGLASWLHAATAAPRGLAAVRAEVLATARSLVPAGTVATAALLIGAAAWKQLLLAAGAVALLLFAGMQFLPRDATPATAASATAVEPARSSLAADAAARASPSAGNDARDELQRTAVAATGTLRVRVLGTTKGEPSWPLGGVPVRVRRDDEEGHASLRRIAHTDASGLAVFADLPAGAWQLRAECLMSEQQGSCSVAAQQTVDVELQLAFERRVRGIVVDAHGAPVADAEVWTGLPFVSEMKPAAAIAHCAGHTDAAGRFAVEVENDARFATLGARKRGYAAAWAMTDPAPGATVRLELGEHPGAIAGTTRDGDGRPYAGATVVVEMDDRDQRQRELGLFDPTPRRRADGTRFGLPIHVVTWTDPEGRYAVDGLRPGNYLCIAQDEGGSTYRPVTVAADAVTELSFVFGGSVELHGTVQLRSGEPMGRVKVTVLDEQGNEASSDWTDARGSFTTLRGPCGPLRVQVHRGERLLAEQTLAPPFTNPQTCALVVAEPPSVRGTLVAADGSALRGWCVRAVAGNQGVDPGVETVTDDHGAFACFGCPDGELRLDVGTGRLSLEHVLCTFPDVARGSDGLRLVVPADRMPTGSATVHIVDAQLQPVPGTVVQLLSPLRMWFQPAEPPTAGCFHFDTLPSGSHMLQVVAPGHVAVHMPVVVRSDAPTDLGEIRLERAALLRVRPCQADGASWPSGLPCPRLRGARGEKLDPFPQSHRDGDAWIFDSLPTGRYQIVVNGGDGMLAAPLPVELRVDQETRVDWATSLGLSIRCAFPSGRGTIAADDALRLTVRDANGRDVPLHDGPWNNGDRWMLFQTFALGDYEVDATSSSGQHWHTTLHVRDLQNDPTSVEVPLQR